MEAVFLLIATFANLWIWKILANNTVVGALVIISTFFLYHVLKWKNKLVYLVLLTIFLLAAYFNTSEKVSLTNQTQGEKLVRERYLKEYPPVAVTLGEKTLWIPIAHWLEERPEMIVLYKLQTNISELISPNYYFFANHPNERVGVDEFEKYPYIIMPLFISGTLFLVRKRKYLELMLFGVLPVLFLGFVGNTNMSGPFPLFPLLSVCIALGLIQLNRFVKTIENRNLKVATAAFLFLIFTAVYIQTILYEIF